MNSAQYYHRLLVFKISKSEASSAATLTVRLGLSRSYRNPHLSGIFEQVGPPLEAFKELRYSPRGNDLDLWIYGKEGQFEADLIIAFSLLSPVRK